MCGKNRSLTSEKKRNFSPCRVQRGAADTPQAVPGRGSSWALPPLIEKQKQLGRCKQAINEV